MEARRVVMPEVGHCTKVKVVQRRFDSCIAALSLDGDC